MAFLQKPIVQIFLVILTAGGIGGGIWYQKNKPADSSATEPANKELGVNAPEKVTTERGDVKRKVIEDTKIDRLILPKEKPAPPPDPVKVVVEEKKEQPRKALPSLVHLETDPEPVFEPEQPRVFGPRGLLIKAALVLTVDSSSIETPVLALVTEDVFWNGELLVPAGTQVFAKATQGKSRDRIEVKGDFTFVWADGREYKIGGVALDHEKENDNTFAISDGSAGIRGEILKTDKYAELKLIIASVVSGFGESSQETFQTVFGEQAENNASNSLLEGVSEASERYAELILSKIEQDLTYVRVTAGTQFYIFTEDVFEPELASVAGLKQGNEALSSIEIQRRAYEAAVADAEAARLRESGAISPVGRGGSASATESYQRRQEADSRDAYLDRVTRLINSSQKFETPQRNP